MGRPAHGSRRSRALPALALPLLAATALIGCGSLDDPDSPADEPIVATPPGAPTTPVTPTGPDGPRPETRETAKPRAGFHDAAEEVCRRATREMREASRSPVAALDPAGLFVDVLGPFASRLRALGPPRELVPALDRIDSMVAEAEARPQQAFGPNIRSLERMTDDLEFISRGFNRAGLQNCGV